MSENDLKKTIEYQTIELGVCQQKLDESKKKLEDVYVAKVKSALLKSAAYPWSEIRSSRKPVSLVYCREVFSYHLKNYGVRRARIAREINRVDSQPDYLANRYQYESAPEFKALAERVKNILDNEIGQ